jgi:hypothetical protein
MFVAPTRRCASVARTPIISERRRVRSRVWRMPHRANKTPEPTPTSVTPRAIECMIEMKQMNPNRSEARGAPAVVVAHLERWARFGSENRGQDSGYSEKSGSGVEDLYRIAAARLGHKSSRRI